jgi:hypothetical protein
MRAKGLAAIIAMGAALAVPSVGHATPRDDGTQFYGVYVQCPSGGSGAHTVMGTLNGTYSAPTWAGSDHPELVNLTADIPADVYNGWSWWSDGSGYLPWPPFDSAGGQEGYQVPVDCSMLPADLTSYLGYVHHDPNTSGPIAYTMEFVYEPIAANFLYSEVDASGVTAMVAHTASRWHATLKANSARDENITVRNAAGTIVRHLASLLKPAASLTWYGHNDQGKLVKSGTYTIRWTVYRLSQSAWVKWTVRAKKVQVP